MYLGLYNAWTHLHAYQFFAKFESLNFKKIISAKSLTMMKFWRFQVAAAVLVAFTICVHLNEVLATYPEFEAGKHVVKRRSVSTMQDVMVSVL